MRFNSIKAGFELKNPAFFRSWLKKVIAEESEEKTGEIQYIFCDDKYLHAINTSFLNHDTYTDIITFPSVPDSRQIISGEIYISIDRVKENSHSLGHSFNEELSRVLVHGLLHLLGYDDGSPKEIELMRQKEDYYLNLQAQKNS